MNQRDRHEHALQVFHDAHTAFGEHPTRRQERHINNSLAEWLGDDATSAQITEALSHVYEFNALNGKDLAYQGMDVEPQDPQYGCALLDHQTNIEDQIMTIINEIDKE